MTLTTIILLLIANIAFGFMLSRSKNGYHKVTFAMHKLTALAMIVLANIYFYRLNSPQVLNIIFYIIIMISFIVLAGTGMMLSLNKSSFKIMSYLHNANFIIFSVFIILLYV